MKMFLLLTGLLLVTTSFNIDKLSDSLCKENEEVVFSFILIKSKKIASLCKDKQGDYLVYRFGTKSNVELVYPQRPDTTSWNAFRLYGEKRWGGKANAGFGNYNLSFVNHNVRYKIFESWSDETHTSHIGVSVTVDKKEFILKGDKTSKQGSLLHLDDEQDKIKNTADEE
jgi:hypothetical protein